MPPPRARNIDDSRSETSSSIVNLKEKSTLGPIGGLGISKAKRSAPGHNGQAAGHKNTMNGNGSVAPPAAAVPSAADVPKDPSLPRTEWVTIPVSILRSYRIAHRLPVPATLHHAHAELIYKSSEVAKRSPSAVYYRRKLHEKQIQRRRLRQTQHTNGTVKHNGNKTKEKAKSKETAPTTDQSSSMALSIAQSIEPPDPNQHSSEQDQSSVSSTAPSSYLGPRLPASNLAAAVRKHFNAQQLVGGEADTIARFIYVVQQNANSGQVAMEGSEGDGAGNWMGSNGREQRRIDGPGGEVGFRLRFRP